MPVFLICFIVFIIWVNVKTKQENRKVSTWDRAYWKREHDANFTRKKKLDEDEYVHIDDTKIPFHETTDDKDASFQKKLHQFLKKKMINLSHMTNTDIKLTYGIANFPLLSEYDQNFLLFQRTLCQWGEYLYQSNQEDLAQQIFEYALTFDCDISSIYICLSQIYQKKGDFQKLNQLSEKVKSSHFYLKNSILEHMAKEGPVKESISSASSESSDSSTDIQKLDSSDSEESRDKLDDILDKLSHS